MRRSLHQRLGDRDPFEWLASRSKSERFLAWACVGISIIHVGGTVISARSTNTHVSTGMALSVYSGFFAHLLFKYLVAMKACRRLGEDRASGALELLLSTPAKDEQILKGLRAGAVSLLGLPMAAVMAGNICMVLVVTFHGKKRHAHLRT